MHHMTPILWLDIILNGHELTNAMILEYLRMSRPIHELRWSTIMPAKGCEAAKIVFSSPDTAALRFWRLITSRATIVYSAVKELAATSQTF